MTSVLWKESATYWDQIIVDLKLGLFLTLVIHTIMLLCFGPICLNYEKEKNFKTQTSQMWIFHPDCSFHIKEVMVWWKEHQMIWLFWIHILRLLSLTLRPWVSHIKPPGFKFLIPQMRDLDYIFSTLYEPLKLKNSRDIFHMTSLHTSSFSICIDFEDGLHLYFEKGEENSQCVLSFSRISCSKNMKN